MSVPRTFTAFISSALRASRENTEAACRTASHPVRARSTAAGSVTSPMAVSTPPTPSGPSAAATFSGDLARTRIRCPARSRAAIECPPTYPDPPVTSTSIYPYYPAAGASERRSAARFETRRQVGLKCLVRHIATSARLRRWRDAPRAVGVPVARWVQRASDHLCGGLDDNAAGVDLALKEVKESAEVRWA